MILTTTTIIFIALFYLGLASVGHRFFLHQLYVSRLLKLFEYGQKKIEKIEKKVSQERRHRRRISQAIMDGLDLDQLERLEECPYSNDSETDSAFADDFESHDGLLFDEFFF